MQASINEKYGGGERKQNNEIEKRIHQATISFRA